jgi:uncharacterized membrane protein
MKAAIAALAFGALAALPAQAGLKLCNRTSYVLYAAAAYSEGVNAVSQGWTRIIPGACQLAIKEPLRAHGYFVYARSSLGHSGVTRAWGGTQKFCVKDADFQLRVPLAAARCPDDDSFDLPFAGVATKSAKAWTMTLDETPAFGSLKDAETAGLKRLLKDQGAKIAALDAKPDKAMDAALAAFRKRLNMTPQASTSDVFDALETEALKTTAPHGYAVCNDTAKAIWVALAGQTGGKWFSRGWWKIAPSGCAKAVTEPLATDKIYVLAQTPGGVPIVYGAQKFCVTNVEFEIQGRGNCASRGQTETGFAETVVKGLSGFTAHVSEGGLVLPRKPQSATPK